MSKTKKYDKLIEKTEKEIEAAKKKLAFHKKRQEAGEITKADFSKLRAKADTHERKLRARLHRYQKLRITVERKLKEKEEEREKRRAERNKKAEEKAKKKKKKS